MGLLYFLCALAVVLLAFYFVRRIPAYVGLSAIVTLGFAVATVEQVDAATVSDWLVKVLALLSCSFGLLVVRVMLIRSVSLRLLAAIDTRAQETIGADIGGRLEDMRAFHLVHRSGDGMSALTTFGRFVSTAVAAMYALFRIDK